MKNPPAGTNVLYRGLRRVLDQGADIGITPDERMDLVATVNHWEEIIAEWRAEAESVMAGAKEKGLEGTLPGPDDPKGGYTAELPVPFQMCLMPHCRKTAVLGGERCEKHGGQWLDPETRQAMLMTSYEKLINASDTAVDTLFDVMVNSRRDDARVAAAKEVLDRVGIRPGSDVHLHVHGDGAETESTVSVIRARLAEMRKTIEEGKAIDPALLSGEEIIDAEVVEDSDDPPDELPTIDEVAGGG
jgi:hypothetical protein